MAKRKYSVVGSFEVYDTKPGGEVTLEQTDELVQVNVDAGLIALAADTPDEPDEKYTCPACAEHIKRPPRFSSHEELADHYGKKHPALALPMVEEATT